MKRLCSIVVCILFIQSVYSQTDSLGNWIVNITAGIEAHDKRLFNYSEKKSLLEMQPEFLGTYHLGLDIQRKIFGKNRTSIFLGTGVSFEKATFDRPFNHLHFKKDSFYILRHQNEYHKMAFPISLNVFFRLNNRLQLTSSIRSYFLLKRCVGRDDYMESTPYNESVFFMDEISTNLGVAYVFNKFWIGLNSRIINYRRIDEIIFNSLIKDPRSDQTWEWSNPLRFELSVGYVLRM